MLMKGLNVITRSQINCVVMKGLNDDEICDFVALTEHMVSVLP